jgi:hypothetical protein
MFNSPTPYAPTGTTTPIYLPRDGNPRLVTPGASYFFIKVHSAQAAFHGSIWEQVNQLLITSQVSLNHRLLGAKPLKAIQRSRAVKRRQAEQLGLSPNLINLVPAAMTHVSVSIEFLLDKKNRLVDLAGLINSDAFLTAVSLAPGAAMVAQTIGGLSEKIIQTFLEPAEQQPILQFNGDFNIPANDLQDGYYVILGSRDATNPLPSPLPPLSIVNGALLADRQPLTRLSYIVLDVRVLEARGRGLSDGAAWAEKLRQAEGVAQRLAADPFAEKEEQGQAWQECKMLIKEAQLLLAADTNYLHDEADKIIKDAYKRCYDQIYGEGERVIMRGEKGLESLDATAVAADRQFLGIDPGEDLTATLGRYAEQVAEARRIMQEAGVS